ncbi:ribonuclease H-like domain-containing protein, partial [Roridomyces roridus]
IQVKGFTGAKYKKFHSNAEAEAWIAGDGASSSTAAAAPAPGASSSSKGKKREMSSDVDADGWDVVYSDGACKGNGQVGSVAGVGVWWGPDDPRNIAERCPGDQTNNRAELIAILRVLETTPNSTRPLMIKTDSQYSIQCFNDWIGGWIKKNWINSSGQPVKNAPLIRYIQAHLEARKRRDQQVKLSYVKGHSGDRGNDGADYQANIG